MSNSEPGRPGEVVTDSSGETSGNMNQKGIVRILIMDPQAYQFLQTVYSRQRRIRSAAWSWQRSLNSLFIISRSVAKRRIQVKFQCNSEGAPIAFRLVLLFHTVGRGQSPVVSREENAVATYRCKLNGFSLYLARQWVQKSRYFRAWRVQIHWEAEGPQRR